MSLVTYAIKFKILPISDEINNLKKQYILTIIHLFNYSDFYKNHFFFKVTFISKLSFLSL